VPPIGEKKGRVEEEEGRWKKVRRAAAGASLLRLDGDARSRTREAPFMTAEEPARSGRRRGHRRRAAAHAKPATTTPPTRCEHRGHPLLLAPVSYLVLVCGRAFEPPLPERVAPLFPHERRPVAPCRRGLGAVATPGRDDRTHSLRPELGLFAGRTEGYLAPHRRALRRARVTPQVRCLGRGAVLVCAVGSARWRRQRTPAPRPGHADQLLPVLVREPGGPVCRDVNHAALCLGEPPRWHVPI
jgi:hypothetical protein